jgi:hypothetical protein
MKKTFISLVVVSSLIYTSSAHAVSPKVVQEGVKLIVKIFSNAKKPPTAKKTPNKWGGVLSAIPFGLPSAEASTNNDFVLTRSAMSGLNEHPQYPIREEVLQAKEQGYSSYKMKVCKNSSGTTYPIPYSVGHCPFSGNGKLYNGPTILLSN